MNEYAGQVVGLRVSADDALARTFEARLQDSYTLAFRVAFGVLRQKQDAEDVAQDAFVKAHGALRQLRDREKFRAWLVRLTWRLALNRRRGDLRRVNRELAAPVPDHAPTSEDVLISEERADRLWRAIDNLPEGMRMTIVLSGIDGHGTRDVAALMGVPEGTVKWRLSEVRKRLQEALRCMTTR